MKHPNPKIRRKYQNNFVPSFHVSEFAPDKCPASVKKGKRVFPGSMSDIFGKWVPAGLINHIFKACADAPQHQYYYLTKYLLRYYELDFSPYSAYMVPPNWWLGHSSDGVSNDGIHCSGSTSMHRFVSIEPFHRRINSWPTLDIPSWVIVGAETSGGRAVRDRMPDLEWILELREWCLARGVPYFEKPSLLQIPGFGKTLIQQWPKDTKRSNTKERI